MDLTIPGGAVVVGLDESGASWLALDRGVDLARRQQRRLVSLNVAELGTRANANRLEGRAVEQAQRRDPAVEVGGTVVAGTDGDVLADVARGGRRARAGIAGPMAGSGGHLGPSPPPHRERDWQDRR